MDTQTRDPRTEPKSLTEVERWRIECFQMLGFNDSEAEYLALSAACLEDARKLHAAGCPNDTALRLLP